MRRFLLSLIFVGALSAVFSFTAFANWTEPVSSAYMGSGQATYNHTVTYNVSASPGDVWYFDVSFTWYGETITNPSNKNITAQVYNRTFDKSVSLTALGVNYGAADVCTEGQRVWLVFNQSVSNVTVTLQFEYSLSWQSGTFNGSPVQDLSDCIATTTVNANCGNINRSLTGLPTLVSADKKLDQILSALGQSAGDAPHFSSQDVLFYFDESYFNYVFIQSGVYTVDDQIYSFSIPTPAAQPFALEFFNYRNKSDRIVSGFLPAGYYWLVLSVPDNVSVDSLLIEPSFSDYDLELFSSSTQNRYKYLCYKLHINKSFSFNAFGFWFNGSSFNGVCYGAVIPFSESEIASESINPDQDGTVSDVDDAGVQQSQQEEQMWQNINTYKGDLSFNLDGWDDASGGLSYVTGIFMTIWNNSPTQPIVLSLMLGIAMLSIGRGVMAAVRVSRNRGDD